MVSKETDGLHQAQHSGHDEFITKLPVGAWYEVRAEVRAVIITRTAFKLVGKLDTRLVQRGLCLLGSHLFTHIRVYG